MRSVITPMLNDPFSMQDAMVEKNTSMPLELPASRIRATLRVLSLLTLLCVGIVPITLLWMFRCDRTRGRAVRIFDILICYIVGLKIHVNGTLEKERPLMLVANHAGYLDVFAIGSLAPVSFTPKREVRSWPVIGFLSVLADSVFVERRPAHMKEARKNMRKRLNKDKIICLFPEGTTSDNKSVIPFKSGFFSLAENEQTDEPLPVQSATLAYTAIGGLPMQDPWREKIAWVGDDTFFDHFWRMLKLPSVTLHIQFHTARILPVGGSRKVLSRECEQEVASTLKALHTRFGSSHGA